MFLSTCPVANLPVPYNCKAICPGFCFGVIETFFIFRPFCKYKKRRQKRRSKIFAVIRCKVKSRSDFTLSLSLVLMPYEVL